MTPTKKRKKEKKPKISFKEQLPSEEKLPRTDLVPEEVDDDFTDGRSSGGLYNRAEESQWAAGDMAEDPGEDKYETAVWEGEQL